MKLRSLELAAFRKFDRPVRIDGFADGINVLCGPNEFGKSTLLAAIRAVLFERHASRGTSVKAMQHHRDETSPLIAMTFEHAGGLHRIEKRFLHREPYARLALPDGTRIEGDAAEERLQALLGFEPAGRNGARPQDIGMWGALWVTQRESVGQPLLPDNARATVHECLEAEVGTMTGSERGQALLRQVREDLARLRDGRGQPRGSLKEAAERAAVLDAELARLTGLRRALADDVASLRQCQCRLAAARDPEKVRLRADELAAARARRDVVRQHEARHEAAAQALRAAQAADAAAAAESARRTERGRQLAAATAEAERTGTTERDARLRLAEADAALKCAGAAARDAEAAADEAGRRARAARRIAELAAGAATLQALGARLLRAERIQDAVNARQGELAAIRVDATRMRAIHAGVRDLAQARAVLDAQATVVLLDLEPGAAGRVLIGGSAAAPGEIRATAELAIDIPGIGRIVIRPGLRDGEAAHGAVAAASRALALALDAAGAADPEDAERRFARRTGCEHGLAEARAALAEAAPADPALRLDSGVEALRNHVAALRRRLETEADELALSGLPSLAEAEAARAASAAEEGRCAAALAPARAALTHAAAEHRKAADQAVQASARRETAVDAVTRLRHDRNEADSREPDQALARRVEGAARDLVACQEALALLQRARPEETLVMLDVRIERFEQIAAQNRETERKLSEQAAVLESSILQREGGGIDEQVATAEHARAAAVRERDARQDEADMLTLLRDTLTDAERAAKERYLAPLAERITPYLRGLFPGASVTCDGNFRITGLARGVGREDESFDRLSDGTQEQIAVLARLAFADLLLDRGHPAMVILDDALAFADETRMERMFDVLNHAARRMQVLVLTCRADTFERLGGHRLALTVGSETSVFA